MLLGTAATGYAGRITATCVDCGKSVDYYVDANVQKIWELDPVESKGISPEQKLAEQERGTAVWSR